jgi:hypothetical protein
VESKLIGHAVFEKIAHMKVGVLITEQNRKKICFLVNQISRGTLKLLKKKSQDEIAVLAAEVAMISAIVMAIEDQFNKALSKTLNHYLKIKTEAVAKEMEEEKSCKDIFVRPPNQKLVKVH